MMRLLILLIMIGLITACEDEVKPKLENAKGNDLDELFEKYAPRGYIIKRDKTNFLTDADVEYQNHCPIRSNQCDRFGWR